MIGEYGVYNMLKISIITVAWNSGKTVRDTIDSVLRQTYHNVEHVIKDGGSTDDTVDIIGQSEERYAETDGKSLNWVSKPDGGIYDAMNKGIGMATGDVIGILNSDDFYTTDDVLAKVAEAFVNDPEMEAVYGDIHFVKDADLVKCTRYFSSRYFRPCLLRFGFMPAHPSFYCRREVYEKFGLYDLKFRTSSDFEMMVRLLAVNKIRTKYLNMDFVTMRAGGESTAGVSSKRKVNNDISGSLKKHGIYSNQLFQSFRYIWRIGEVLYTKIKY